MLNVFGSVPNKDDILVPQIPMILQLNYQTESLFLPNKVYKGVSMTVSILKCYRLFGDRINSGINKVWGFIYYIVETGWNCSTNNTLNDNIVLGSWLNDVSLLALDKHIRGINTIELNPSELLWYIGFCGDNRVYFDYYSRDKQQLEKLDYYRKLVAENSYKLAPPVSPNMLDISHLHIPDWTLSPDTFSISDKPYIEKKSLRKYAKNLVI